MTTVQLPFFQMIGKQRPARKPPFVLGLISAPQSLTPRANNTESSR